MGDDNFDPCECVWGHELAMRRLLSLLRNSQSHCTDTECFVDGSQQPTQTSDYYIVMTIMVAIYFFLHFWLVRNQRNRISEPTKPSLGGNGPNGTPPTPPPTPPPTSS